MKGERKISYRQTVGRSFSVALPDLTLQFTGCGKGRVRIFGDAAQVKHRKDAVAHELQYVSAKFLDRRNCDAEIVVQHLDQLGSGNLLRQLRKALEIEIADHSVDLP